MMDLDHRASELADLIEAKLGIRGKALADKLARAGRLLPRKLRADGQLIVQALALRGNPKLAVQIDQTAIETAFRDLTTFLDSIDPRDRKVGALLGMGASFALAVLILVFALIALAYWRGLL